MLLAFANPKLPPESITCTDGQRVRTCSAVPSADALSTTVMVVGNGAVWPTSDCRQASISSMELKVTMMIARLSLSAKGRLLEDRQRLRRPRASQSYRDSTASA